MDRWFACVDWNDRCSSRLLGISALLLKAFARNRHPSRDNMVYRNGRRVFHVSLRHDSFGRTTYAFGRSIATHVGMHPFEAKDWTRIKTAANDGAAMGAAFGAAFGGLTALGVSAPIMLAIGGGSLAVFFVPAMYQKLQTALAESNEKPFAIFTTVGCIGINVGGMLAGSYGGRRVDAFAKKFGPQGRNGARLDKLVKQQKQAGQRPDTSQPPSNANQPIPKASHIFRKMSSEEAIATLNSQNLQPKINGSNGKKYLSDLLQKVQDFQNRKVPKGTEEWILDFKVKQPEFDKFTCRAIPQDLVGKTPNGRNMLESHFEGIPNGTPGTNYGIPPSLLQQFNNLILNIRVLPSE